MDMDNSKPNETVPATVGNAPEAAPSPVPEAASVPVLGLASSAPGTDTPKASPSIGGLGAGAS
ncbi:MAG: hypothetical protein ABSA10_06850, partial [Anaerolineales bacterium]